MKQNLMKAMRKMGACVGDVCRGGLRALVVGGLLALVPCAWAEAGFVKAVFSGSAYDGTSSIWEAEGATIVEDLAEIYTVRTDFPSKTTWAYGTYMQFEGGVDYLFHTYFDDHATVKIDDLDLLP